VIPQSYQVAFVWGDLDFTGTPMRAIAQTYPCRIGWYGAGLSHPDFTRFYYDAATGRTFTDR
jgi:hypothetical protein